MTDHASKYIEHFVKRGERMAEDEAREYLLILRGLPDEYSARRIAKLVTYLDGIERGRSAEAEWERTWVEAAREYKALTERWEALGATWRGVGTALVKWEYEGVEFYRWWSRTLITDNIVEARKADERLTEIITEKGAII